jgi:hypothetical protein
MLFFRDPDAEGRDAPQHARRARRRDPRRRRLARAVRLTDAPPVLQEGVTATRIGAAALSVALTALVLRLLSCPHPPL